MPAIITHHIFGEDAVATLPGDIIRGEEELLAFLLGNQGPDPFYARFSTLPQVARACHSFANQMQGHSATRAFMCLRDGVSHLHREDERIGRAFALGVLGHYALDSVAHPFVYAQQDAIVEADPSLEPGSNEVHAVIETDIDTWILWEKRRATVLERPAARDLMRTERISRVGGALFSLTALSVFGYGIDAKEYGACVADYEFAYRAFEPAGSVRARVLGRIERLARPHSMAESLAHAPVASDDCAAANLDCRPWTNPFTGEVRFVSFADLYDEALVRYPRLAEAFVRGDEGAFRHVAGGLSYEGRPGTDY